MNKKYQDYYFGITYHSIRTPIRLYKIPYIKSRVDGDISRYLKYGMGMYHYDYARYIVCLDNV